MDLLYKYQRIQELPNTKEKLHKIININHEFLEHDELDLYIQSGIDIITLSLEFVELETAERYIRRLSDLVGIVEHNEYETILDLKIQYHIACCEYDEALYSLELKKPYLTTVSSFDSFYMTLGNVLFLKEDFIGAINTFNKINNEDLNYQKNVSLILLHLEVYNVDIAQDIYQKVKSQQPSNDMYYLIDSKIAKINNELLESLELMEKYYNKTNDPSCIIEYIELLIENKKIDQAKELYNTSKNMINTNKNTDVIKFDKLYHLLYTKKLPKQKQRMNMSDYIELLELERNNSLHELLSNVFQRIFSKLQCTRLSYLDLYIDQSEIYYFKSKLLLSKSIDLSTLSNTFFEFCLLNEEEIIIEDDLTKYIDFFTNKYYSKSTSILTMKLAFDDHVSALLIAEYDHENYHQDEFYFIGKMINELVFSYYNHEKSKHTKQLNKLMVQKNGLGSIKLNKNHINVSEEAKTILGTEENMLSYDEFDTIIQDDDYHDLKNSIYLPNDIHHVQLVNGNIIDILFYSEYPNYRFLIERKAYYTKLLNLTDLSYKNTHNHFKNETRFLLDYPNIDKNKTSLIMFRFNNQNRILEQYDIETYQNIFKHISNILNDVYHAKHSLYYINHFQFLIVFTSVDKRVINRSVLQVKDRIYTEYFKQNNELIVLHPAVSVLRKISNLDSYTVLSYLHLALNVSLKQNNKIIYFEKQILQEIKQNSTIKKRIIELVALKKLPIRYQPVVNSISNQVILYYADIDESILFFTKEKLYEIANKDDLIIEFEQLLIVALIKEIVKIYKHIQDNIIFVIKLSNKSLYKSNLLSLLYNALKKRRIPMHMIAIEISLDNSLEQLCDIEERIHQYGFLLIGSHLKKSCYLIAKLSKCNFDYLRYELDNVEKSLEMDYLQFLNQNIPALIVDNITTNDEVVLLQKMKIHNVKGPLYFQNISIKGITQNIL